MSEQESNEVILGRLDERIGNMHGRIERIDKTLHENGLIVQVDRNTQWRKSWRRHITTVISFLLLVAAIIAIIVQNWKESP